MIKNTCWREDKPGRLQCGPFASTSISGGHRSPRISEAGSALMHIPRIGIQESGLDDRYVQCRDGLRAYKIHNTVCKHRAIHYLIIV